MTARREPPPPLLRVLMAIAAGVLVAAVADTRARAGDPARLLFWLAILLIVAPAAFLLAGRRAGRAERIAIVVATGLGLYAVKVLRDPFAFTYGDELAHLRNLQSILDGHALFGTNTILPVTARYPGLESVAAALSATAGISPFAAGLLTIALARTLFMLAVYLLYERLTGSPRLAGVGALLTTAAPTYLYFSAQFSYESLAVPLGVAAVYALARRQTAPDAAARRRWSLLLVALGAGVIATHHLTAYALVAFLLAVCGVTALREQPRWAPWRPSAVLAALTVAMTATVAGQTTSYLSPVIGGAIRSIADTIALEAGPRKLFSSPGGVDPTPPPERLLAVLAVILLTTAILAGIRAARRSPWASPIAVVLALAALGFLGTQPLRLVPAAWESANRAGTVLFIGVGLIGAAGLFWWLHPDAGRTLRRVTLALVLTAIVGGGIVAGWPSALRLAAPYRATAGGETVEPPAVDLARWAAAELRPPVVIGAQDADARLLVTIGRQPALQGVHPDIAGVLDATRIEPWQRTLLRDNKVALVAVDRRALSSDNIAGYAFQRGTPILLAPATVTKFDRADTDRLYDAGNLVVFDVRRLW